MAGTETGAGAKARWGLTFRGLLFGSLPATWINATTTAIRQLVVDACSTDLAKCIRRRPLFLVGISLQAHLQKEVDHHGVFEQLCLRRAVSNKQPPAPPPPPKCLDAKNVTWRPRYIEPKDLPVTHFICSCSMAVNQMPVLMASICTGCFICI